jgi:hypothetical protein
LQDFNEYYHSKRQVEKRTYPEFDAFLFNASNRRYGTNHDLVRCTNRHYSMLCNLTADESTRPHATHGDHPTSTTARASKQNQHPAIL